VSAPESAGLPGNVIARVQSTLPSTIVTITGCRTVPNARVRAVTISSTLSPRRFTRPTRTSRIVAVCASLR
jgi:hypothetical protein